MELYSKPIHITETSNGDAVVSDFDLVYNWTSAVVVTDHGRAIVLPVLLSQGICTNELFGCMVIKQKQHT